MNHKTPLDQCPRCGGDFRCGAHDDEPCACSAVSLSPAILAQLREQYQGCLCLNCMRLLAAFGTVEASASVKDQ